jgi:hypothetical protein
LVNDFWRPTLVANCADYSPSPGLAVIICNLFSFHFPNSFTGMYQ